MSSRPDGETLAAIGALRLIRRCVNYARIRLAPKGMFLVYPQTDGSARSFKRHPAWSVGSEARHCIPDTSVDKPIETS